jgi:hypothetical protein
MEKIIRKIVYGKFYSQHFTKNFEESFSDISTQRIADALSEIGNISDPFDFYFTTYSDDSFTLLFIYPLQENTYGLGGTTLYRMREYRDPNNLSFMYNDSDPNDQFTYTSTLTIAKMKVHSIGNIAIFRQSQANTDCVELIGMTYQDIPEDEIKNTDIYSAIVKAYTNTSFIENKT